MAVYTPISETELSAFLTEYGIGTLVVHEGIEAGVSNTNYFVTTTMGRYVLTLFEPHRVDAQDIDGFINYAVAIEQGGVLCPRTIPRNDGRFLGALNNRPAAFFSVLDGEVGNVAASNPARCERAGAVLARMHHVGLQDIGGIHSNKFGIARMAQWLSGIGTDADEIEAGLGDLMLGEFDEIQSGWRGGLPEGAIHGDYFPDNVFFDGDDVTGVIDFHFVCRDYLAYDLAIAINAWCFDKNNNFVPERMDAMMRGYESVRPLSSHERENFTILLRRAALRFLLSRCEEKLSWTPDVKMIPHDPLVFKKRLMHFKGMSSNEYR